MKRFFCKDLRTGERKEIEVDFSARFATVKKYVVLYKEELKRFRKRPRNIYALPFYDEPQKIYNGLGRTGLFLGDRLKKHRDLNDAQRALVEKLYDDPLLADRLMFQEEDALAYVSLHRNADDFELIWTRLAGADDEIPQGYQFAGYDISYEPDCTGAFSIICDCMFVCLWHGCDKEGTLFREDFEKLNADGLFDHWQDAYAYMNKYLTEEWTERGAFGIFEIYKKAEENEESR